MLILLDCRPLQYAGAANERARLVLSCARWLSSRREVRWLFLVEKGWKKKDWPFVKDLEGEWLPLKALPGGLGWRWWYDWQIPRIAGKYKVDMVMTTGGRAAGAMDIPQGCWLPYGKPGLSRKRFAKSLDRTGVVFCFSEEDGKRAGEKAHLVHPAAETSILPASGGEKESARALYAEGKEYFFADISGVPFSGVIHLLKAFSVFKKRQQSNMKFLLAGTGPGIDKKFAGNLENYKFRQDIHWVAHPGVDEWGRMKGGAYGVICCPRVENIGLAVLDAWKRGVPVISMAATSLREAGDALLQMEKEDDTTRLAEYLKLLYKDEAARSRLVEKGLFYAAYFNPERSADEVWEGISAIKS